MRKRTIVAVTLMILLSSSQVASASYMVCSQPHAPQPYLRTPSKPYCVQNKSCSQFDVDNYRREVSSYIDALRDYLHDVDSYRHDAYEYAKCMADID